MSKTIAELKSEVEQLSNGDRDVFLRWASEKSREGWTKAKRFFSSWIPVAVVYPLTLLLLWLGTVVKSNWPLWVTVGLFTIWDSAWVWTHSASHDRTAQETLESSTRARTYTSYFIAIYGAGLAYFLLRLGGPSQQQVVTLIKNANVSTTILLAPLLLSAVALMFFPIRLGFEKTSENSTLVPLSKRTPTASNRAILALCAWTQKVGTFCFVYAVARIGAYLAR